MIYFIKREDGAIKIGHAGDVMARLRELERKLSSKMELLGVMDGHRDQEQEAHARFNHLRLRPAKNVEWFHQSSELMDFIRINAGPIKPRRRDVLPKPLPCPQDGQESEAIPPGENFIRVAISDDDRDSLRVIAAKHGMSMAAYVRWLIRNEVTKETEGGK